MKKYLQALTTKDITRLLLLLLQLAFGCWLGSFYGGVLVGSAGLCLVLGVVGKMLFAKTVSRIDKQIKDTITNQ